MPEEEVDAVVFKVPLQLSSVASFAGELSQWAMTASSSLTTALRKHLHQEVGAPELWNGESLVMVLGGNTTLASVAVVMDVRILVPLLDSRRLDSMVAVQSVGYLARVDAWRAAIGKLGTAAFKAIFQSELDSMHLPAPPGMSMTLGIISKEIISLSLWSGMASQHPVFTIAAETSLEAGSEAPEVATAGVFVSSAAVIAILGVCLGSVACAKPKGIRNCLNGMSAKWKHAAQDEELANVDNVKTYHDVDGASRAVDEIVRTISSPKRMHEALRAGIGKLVEGTISPTTPGAKKLKQLEEASAHATPECETASPNVPGLRSFISPKAHEVPGAVPGTPSPSALVWRAMQGFVSSSSSSSLTPSQRGLRKAGSIEPNLVGHASSSSEDEAAKSLIRKDRSGTDDVITTDLMDQTWQSTTAGGETIKSSIKPDLSYCTDDFEVSAQPAIDGERSIALEPESEPRCRKSSKSPTRPAPLDLDADDTLELQAAPQTGSKSTSHARKAWTPGGNRKGVSVAHGTPASRKKASLRLPVPHAGTRSELKGLMQDELDAVVDQQILDHSSRPASTCSSTNETPCTRLFKQIDVDKDGIISREEYNAALRSGILMKHAPEPDETPSTRLFRQIDTDEDGIISPEEYDAALRSGVIVRQQPIAASRSVSDASGDGPLLRSRPPSGADLRRTARSTSGRSLSYLQSSTSFLPMCQPSAPSRATPTASSKPSRRPRPLSGSQILARAHTPDPMSFPPDPYWDNAAFRKPKTSGIEAEFGGTSSNSTKQRLADMTNSQASKVDEHHGMKSDLSVSSWASGKLLEQFENPDTAYNTPAGRRRSRDTDMELVDATWDDYASPRCVEPSSCSSKKSWSDQKEEYWTDDSFEASPSKRSRPSLRKRPTPIKLEDSPERNLFSELPGSIANEISPIHVREPPSMPSMISNPPSGMPPVLPLDGRATGSSVICERSVRSP